MQLSKYLLALLCAACAPAVQAQLEAAARHAMMYASSLGDFTTVRKIALTAEPALQAVALSLLAGTVSGTEGRPR